MYNWYFMLPFIVQSLSALAILTFKGPATLYASSSAELVDNDTVQFFFPYFLMFSNSSIIGMTGAWESPFLAFFWPPFTLAITAAPTVKVNVWPLFALAFSLQVFMFNPETNPFPQLQVLEPRFVSLLVYFSTLISLAARFSKWRQIAATIIANEIRASDSKGRFIAVASHEMRTPLTAILGWAELLSQRTSMSEEDQQIVATIRACGKSLLGIINNVLDFSKFEKAGTELERTPFDLDNVDSCRVLVKPGVRLVAEVDLPIRHLVIGDPHRLGQIITNLISNAAKFTENGQITVSAKSDPMSSEDRLAVSFSIADSGIGMDEATLKRLFKPFMQADSSVTRKYGGTGLGLLISKNLVESMGGRIQVRSELHMGTVFSWMVEFDRVRNAPVVEDREDIQLTKSLETLRVLLVEDNPFNQKLLKHALEKNNCIVVVADNGEIALDILDSELEEDGFDLIISDIQMPVMDGIRATQEIRARGLTLPVVGLTANADDETRTDAIKAGMDELLTKPISVATLSKIVHRFCIKRLESGSPPRRVKPAGPEPAPSPSTLGVPSPRSPNSARLWKSQH